MMKKRKKMLTRVMAGILAGVLAIGMAAGTAMAAFADDTPTATPAVTPDPYGVVAQTAGDTNYQLSDPSKAAIVFHVVSLPGTFSGGVTCDVRYSPDNGYDSVTVSALNEWTAAVEVKPGDNLYWSTTATNDITQTTPVTPDYQSIFAYNTARGLGDQTGLAAGEVMVVNLSISGKSMYEQMTGQKQNYTVQEVVPTEEGYDVNAAAQIGVYASCTDGFEANTDVYLENMFTGKVYTLTLYAANNMTAIDTTATQGLYKYIGCKIYSVTGDESSRYTVTMENDTLYAPGDASKYHLTIVDNKKPDVEIRTPTLDNNEVYQETMATATPEPSPASTATPTATPAPVQATGNSAVGYVMLGIIGAIIAAGVGAYVYVSRRNR